MEKAFHFQTCLISNWDAGKPCCTCSRTFFIGFLPCIASHKDNPLCQAVLNAHEQKQFTLHCASHVCYGHVN